jgi:hypothetical protein
MGGELGGDLCGKDFDLLDEADEGGRQGAGDVRVGGAVLADGAARGGGKTGVQRGRVGAAGVAHRGQPGTQPFGDQPVGAVLAVKPGQKLQADRRIQVLEQPQRAGKHALEVLTELVGHGHPVDDQLLAHPAGRAQRRRGRAVGDQWPQSGPVGAQRISEHKGVKPSSLLAAEP